MIGRTREEREKYVGRLRRGLGFTVATGLIFAITGGWFWFVTLVLAGALPITPASVSLARIWMADRRLVRDRPGALEATVLRLAAQDAATVVYAEGDAFSILRRSGDMERLTWRDLDFIGVGLADGDTILTEDGTFLELRMNASNSTVRISENTSFEISQGGDDGSDTRLAVTYGRVRAVVQRNPRVRDPRTDRGRRCPGHGLRRQRHREPRR